MKWDSFEYRTVLKLDKLFFGFEEDVFLIYSYIRPATSSRNTVDSDTERYNKLIDKISQLSPFKEIMLLGDLNSRMSGLRDFSPTDESENDLDFTRNI